MRKLPAMMPPASMPNVVAFAARFWHEQGQDVHAEHENRDDQADADLAQIDGGDPRGRHGKGAGPLPQRQRAQPEDHAEQRREHPRARDGARRIEQSRGPYDHAPVRTGISHGAQAERGIGDHARQLGGHPPIGVVHLQHADHRVDPAADEQKPEQPCEMLRRLDERRRPEQRRHHGEVHHHVREAADERRRVGVEQHDGQQPHHRGDPGVGSMRGRPRVRRAAATTRTPRG